MLILLRRVWLAAFFLACGVAIWILAAKESEHLQLPELRYIGFILVGAGIQIAFWLSATRMWMNVVSAVAGVSLSFWDSFRQSALVGLGKYLPGKIWGLVARGAHLGQLGLSARSATTLTLNEQAILLHSAFLISTALYAAIRPSMAAFAALAAAAVSVWLGNRVLQLAITVLDKFAKRFVSAANSAETASLTRFQYIRLVAGYSGVWILSGGIVLCLYAAFFTAQINVDLALILIVANAAAVSLGFFAVFAPGGIGVREAIAVTILSAYVPVATATMLVILLRLWTIGADVLAGLLALSRPTVDTRQ